MTNVTIVMPAYNVENYIASSIESVIQQTYQDWELIVINDGSTDESQKIIEKYISIDKRISLINQKNQGVSMARNKGLAIAKGKYISFLDADDTYAPTYIELMRAPLTLGSKISFCKYKKITENGEILVKTPEEITSLYLNSFINHINKKPYAYADMAFMYDLELLRAHNHLFYTGATNGEDTEFLLKATCLAPKQISFIPEYLYIYLSRMGSATNRELSFPIITSQLSAFYRFKDFITRIEIEDKSEYLDFTYKKIIMAQKMFIKLCWRNLRKGNFSCVSNQIRVYEKISQKELYWGNSHLTKKEVFKKSIIRYISVLTNLLRS